MRRRQRCFTGAPGIKAVENAIQYRGAIGIALYDAASFHRCDLKGA